MIESMTGYCCEEVSWELESGKSLRLSIEAKSLNSRFFELGMRIPSALMALENRLISIFKEKLIRGKVFLTLKFLDEDVSLEDLSINKSLVQAYLKAAKDLEKIAGAQSEIKTFEWLSLQKVVSFDSQKLSDSEVDNFLEIAKNIAGKLFEDRAREGLTIIKDLEQSLVKIEELEAVILDGNKTILLNLRTKLDNQKIFWHESKDGRHEHEVAIEHKKVSDLEALLERCDISEEISRSSMHIQSLKNMFNSKSYEVGKKLEFTLQELLRETNTISSKSSSFEVNTACVNIKFELEKIREQAQNIV